MRDCSAALKAHLAAGGKVGASIAACWLTVRVDGTVTAFTGHESDLSFNLESWLTSRTQNVPARMVGTGLHTYQAAYGFQATDIVTSSDLSVDNLEIAGAMLPEPPFGSPPAPPTNPFITLPDIMAGRWDFCFVILFFVNVADLTMGALVMRCGTIGEINTQLDLFRSELRGLTQAYTRQIGELTSASCRAVLGDARCKVDLTGGSPVNFTVSGHVTGIGTDNATIFDTARTEAGPSGGVAIAGVTNANPGVVTFHGNSFFALADGESVIIAGVIGPGLINTVTQVHNPTDNTFELSIDTSDTSIYPVYLSGGTVTPLGAESGWFDYGVITFTSGLNAGLSMEVKSYTVGQIVLWLPMPFVIAVGDAYTMVAGCDKTIDTCNTKFGNVVNFRGEPYLPGVDRLVQVTKPTG